MDVFLVGEAVHVEVPRQYFADVESFRRYAESLIREQELLARREARERARERRWWMCPVPAWLVLVLATLVAAAWILEVLFPIGLRTR